MHAFGRSSRRSRRAPRRRAWLVAGLALLSSGACARPTPYARVRYVDWVTRVGLPSDSAVPPGQLTACGDLSRMALPMARNRPITVTLPLLDAPRLEISLCLGRAPNARRLRAPVEVTVKGLESGRRLRRILQAPREQWHKVGIELAEFAREPVAIEIAAQPPARQVVWARELYVRQTEPAARAPKGVVLISLDALRADALDGFGGRFPVTGLRRLAGLGETWTWHYAAANWTKPSHATLLTGRLPWTHLATSAEAVIQPALPTVAERFRAAGYRTSAWVYESWLLPKFGFGRGFESYRSARQFTAEVARQLVEWLADDDGRPYFVFLHLMDPHSDFMALPYEVEGRQFAASQAEFAADLGPCPSKYCGSRLLAAFNGGRPIGVAERALITRLYQESADRVATELEVLWRDLAAGGVLDPSLIVLTADHGEELFEHEGTLHASLYEEVVRVPLIVKWPGNARAGSVRGEPSSGHDIAKTMLAAAGLEIADLGGTDLGRGDPPGPIVVGTRDWAVVDGGLKAVVRLDGPPQLFDLERDPGERSNLLAGAAAEPTRRFEALRRRGLEVRRRDQAEAPVAAGAPAVTAPLSAEEQTKLRALGYL